MRPTLGLPLGNATKNSSVERPPIKVYVFLPFNDFPVTFYAAGIILLLLFRKSLKIYGF